MFGDSKSAEKFIKLLEKRQFEQADKLLKERAQKICEKSNFKVCWSSQAGNHLNIRLITVFLSLYLKVQS